MLLGTTTSGTHGSFPTLCLGPLLTLCSGTRGETCLALAPPSLAPTPHSSWHILLSVSAPDQAFFGVLSHGAQEIPKLSCHVGPGRLVAWEKLTRVLWGTGIPWMPQTGFGDQKWWQELRNQSWEQETEHCSQSLSASHHTESVGVTSPGSPRLGTGSVFPAGSSTSTP